MNRVNTDELSACHVSAMSGGGNYCFVVYATHRGHQHIFSIEATNNEELIENIWKMFESIKAQCMDGDISEEIGAMVSQIILREHSNA